MDNWRLKALDAQARCAALEKYDDRLVNVLCGAAFLQGQLLGALRSIESEGHDCRCGFDDSCGCGRRMAWMADDLCDLLAEAVPE